MDDPLSYFMGAFTVGRSNHKIPHYDGLSISILARELRGQGQKKIYMNLNCLKERISGIAQFIKYFCQFYNSIYIKCSYKFSYEIASFYKLQHVKGFVNCGVFVPFLQR